MSHVHDPIVVSQCSVALDEEEGGPRGTSDWAGWAGADRARDQEAARPHRPAQPWGRGTIHHPDGQWYATAIFWKPQVALFVSEPTLLPVLMPLAPTATLLARFPQQVTAVLTAHRTPQAVIDEDLRQMRDRRLAKTANRSVVGIMNEFTSLANAYREDTPTPDLLALAIRLAATPCGPLYSKHVSPDRELAALLRSFTSPES
jgi:hypothetical protein